MYGTVTLVYLIVSSSGDQDSRLGSPFRLLSVLVAAVFWPATLVVLGLSALRPGRDPGAAKAGRSFRLMPVHHIG